jgi:superfamily II DNA or RNA helicase
MKLYPYQENVIEATELDLSHSQLISMPTGTGKTITFLALAKKLNKRCLILVHREELLNQTYEKAKFCGIEEQEISVVKAGSKEEIRKYTIAMVQTLARNLERYKAEDVECIIVDEAHHATAQSYRNIFDHFKIFDEKKLIFGFTATPLRGDKGCLSSIFHSHSFKMTLSEATKMGFICPVYGLRVEMDKSLGDIDTVQGDYDMTQLDKVMNCPEVNNVIVEKCKNVRKSPGIIFCTSVNHAQTLAKMLREQKVKAISISYMTGKKTLDRIYKMLHRGAIDFITNAVKLSEGFDYPPIQSIIIARPTRSPVLYKQMIGRGLRKSKDKDDCVVVEFSGSDESMLKWEDIDENATFQTVTRQQQMSEKEAKNKIQEIFGEKIKVLDVRMSPFQFYECKMTRLECYKKYFYYMPGKDRFIIYRIVEAEKQCKNVEKYYNVVVWHCVWRKEMEDFYVWNDGAIYYTWLGYDKRICHSIMREYIDKQPFGKWYPSEQDLITSRQRKILGNVKYSARKAEFLIEDQCYKKMIEDEWVNGKYSDYKYVIKKFQDSLKERT